jgi:FkbH-like protein
LDFSVLSQLRDAFPAPAAFLSELRDRLGTDPTLLSLLEVQRCLEDQPDLLAGHKRLNLALLADHTLEGLLLPLKTFARLRGLDLQMTLCPTYQIEPQLINQDSELHRAEADALIALFDFEKTLIPSHVAPTDAEQEGWRQTLLSRLDLLADFSRQKKTRVFIGDFVAALGPLSPPYVHVAAFSRQPFLQWANLYLADACRERHLELLPLSAVTAARGYDKCISLKRYLSTDTSFTASGFNGLADLITRQLAANFTPRKKALAVDLDNTLWGGVLGEDGPEGIAYRPDSYRGRIFHTALRWMKTLSESGILLTIASKNNEAEVMAVLARDDFPLKAGDFAAHRINWDPKPNNLAAIAEELSLSLDSFVFLDDSPAECMLMRQAFPQVTVLQVPPALGDYPAALAGIEGFDRARLTESDRARKVEYQQAHQRRAFEASVGNFDVFLRELKIRLEVGPVNESNLDRVVQLFERTNQFNLSAVRYRREDLQQYVVDANRLLCVNYADRFGPSGLVGALVFSIAGHVLEIENFVLSCRVLGRRVEYAVVAALAERLRTDGVEAMRLNYRQTNRNDPARDFVRSLAAVPGGVVPIENFRGPSQIAVAWCP